MWPSLDDILKDFDFHRDSAGVFHTTPDCWQSNAGYADLYDWVFDASTEMRKKKYPVTVNGEEYCIWMWKGDYLNLGAGAETGIYKGGEPFWDTAIYDALPMTLTLYDKDGNTIMYYAPEDPQWWITGFDPMEQGVDPDDLKVIGSINMKENSDVWKVFEKKYNNSKFNNVFCFDNEEKTVYYKW